MVFKRLAKDSAIYGGADFFTKFIAFFSFPLIAAALSPKAFGVLELVTTSTTLLGLLVNCGINNAVSRYYWEVESTIRPTLVSTGLFILVTFSVFVVLSVLFAIPWLSQLLQNADWPLSWIGLVAALLLMALSQWNSYILDILRLHLAPWRFMGCALVSRVGSITMSLIAVVIFGLGIDGLLGAQFLVLLLVLPFTLFMIRKDLRLCSFDYRWATEMLKYGYPFIFAGLAYWLFGSMDRWMLAAMTSVDEVGIYSIAFRFASIVLFVSAAFGQAWSPVAIKIRMEQPGKYRTIFGQVLIVILCIMLIIGGGLALFAGELIALIMPVEYQSSALPFIILCFGVVLQSTQQVTLVGISIEKKTALIAKLSWIAAAINFVLNWLLIPIFGAVGAAWATVFSFLFITGSYLFFTQKLHPLIINWKLLFMLVIVGIFLLILSILFQQDQVKATIVVVKMTLVVISMSCVFLLIKKRGIPLRL